MKKLLIISLALVILFMGGCGSEATKEVPTQETENTTHEPSLTQPTPATFTISDLSISPTEIDIGERITISAVATNNGDLAGDYNVVFKINNIAVETVVLTMDGGDSQRVDFAATVEYAAGTYSVDVNGLSGIFTVMAAPPSAIFTITSFDQTYYEPTIDYEVRITLTEYIRGEQAWQLIEEANMFNTLPETGFEYILAKVRFEYLKGPTPNTAYEVSSVWFDAVSSTGQDYDMTWNVDPDPSIDADLYPGASHEGWVSFQVAVDDVEPLMTFGRKYDGTGGIWFKLYEAVSGPMPTPSLGYSRSNPVGTGVPLSIWVGTSGIGGDEESWSDYVYIYFDVENNGIVYLNYYEVYFTITCDDGSKIQDWTNGTDVLVGQKWSDWAITDVGSKKVVSVEITNWELQAGTSPYIIYEITGTADEVDVTLNNATGGTEQYSNVSIPVKYSYSSFPDSFLYISAQNQGEYGTVKVTIYLNGEVFKTAYSSGAYVIASASGLRP